MCQNNQISFSIVHCDLTIIHYKYDEFQYLNYFSRLFIIIMFVNNIIIYEQ